MHSTFLKVTHLESNQSAHERIWYELAKSGYSPEDIGVFLRWVTYENSRQEDPKYRRKFHIPRMFGDIAEFDADLSLARAWDYSRKPPITQQERALQDLRPLVNPELHEPAMRQPARAAGDILKAVMAKLNPPTR